MALQFPAKQGTHRTETDEAGAGEHYANRRRNPLHDVRGRHTERSNDDSQGDAHAKRALPCWKIFLIKHSIPSVVVGKASARLEAASIEKDSKKPILLK
jgi:hypothetical protein